MINAMHILLYSRDPAADRAFFRDVLGWPYVENAGSEPGWLIFKTPPAELGIHPTDGPPTAEVSLMCDDINATVATLAARGVPMTDVNNRGYGIAVDVTLPGGGTIQLYEPRHEIAHSL
ncbi:MAG TPA: VOC family protein [Micromonosporaceae bacterium]|nr:VOC family protein [Micromonosporaceae bacterium]